MKLLGPIGAMTLLGLSVLPAAWASDCHYTLKSTRLLQCHAIKQIKNSSGKALWTYVDSQPNEPGVLAHVLCTCDAAAHDLPSDCEPPRSHHVTFTLDSKNVRETCSEGPSLCQEPCQQLLSQTQ